MYGAGAAASVSTSPLGGTAAGNVAGASLATSTSPPLGFAAGKDCARNDGSAKRAIMAPATAMIFFVMERTSCLHARHSKPCAAHVTSAPPATQTKSRLSAKKPRFAADTRTARTTPDAHPSGGASRPRPRHKLTSALHCHHCSSGDTGTEAENRTRAGRTSSRPQPPFRCKIPTHVLDRDRHRPL